MGSPLGPALANIFMCSFESIWLQDCPNDFKSVFCRRYVDDIFALFSSPDLAVKFKKYLPSKHPTINFSIEKEKNGCLPFLDVNIFRENKKFATNVCRKKTFSGFVPTSKVLYLKQIKLVLKSILYKNCFAFKDKIPSTMLPIMVKLSVILKETRNSLKKYPLNL